MKRVTAPALALLLVLAACAPATVQTAGGPQTVTVLGGVGYTLANRLPLEALTGETSDDTAITFTGCQGGAVRAADVRRVGPEAALLACQQAIQRSTDAQTGWQTLTLILAPITLYLAYLMFKGLGCAFSLGTAEICR